jgi:hypothetical protein
MPCCSREEFQLQIIPVRGGWIAGSVANNVGLSASQLHLIPVEKCADCRFAGFRLQVVTPKPEIG